MNSDSKVSSVLLFLASYPFTKKLNAVGISNIPTALKAYQNTKKDDLKNDVKQKLYAYIISIFHSSAVLSALFGRYPSLIQAHAVVGIGAAVKESIAVRREEEERARLEAERRAARSSSTDGVSISRRLKSWMFGSSSSSEDDKEVVVEDNVDDAKREASSAVSREISSISATESEAKETSTIITKQDQGQEDVDTAKSKSQKLTLRKRFFTKSSKPASEKKDAKDKRILSSTALASTASSAGVSTTSTSVSVSAPKKPKKSKTAKAQKAVKRTKSILKGKRDSSTDDIIWGVFQASFVLLDQTIGKALAYAWLLFLLTLLEEAVFNPKLNKEQRLKRFCWIVATGYYSGKLVLPDFSAIAGGNTADDGNAGPY